MKSPFPGMDPCLEDPAFWPDFYKRFNTYWCDFLADQLPDNYEARIDEIIRLVEVQTENQEGFQPEIEEIREVHINLLNRPDRTLIAVLELLSPWNKSHRGQSEYLGKRLTIQRQRIHMVELDLLVGGNRLPLRQPLPLGDYFALISRSDNRPKCDVYAWTVRQPLPPIRIPLKAPDPDIVFNLGAVLDMAYERGKYARSLNYRQPPLALFSPEDGKWIRERGLTQAR